MRRAADFGSRSAQFVFLATLLCGVLMAPGWAAEGSYRVVEGDTLYGIARELNLPLDALLSANQLTAKAVIRVGQVLIIPTDDPVDESGAETPAATAVPVAGAQSCQVQAGDNLFRIAERFQTTVEELARLNQLTPQSILQIGQTLRLPGSGSLAAEEAGATVPVKPTPLLASMPAAAEVAEAATQVAGAAAQVASAAVSAAAGAGALPEAVWVSETRVHLRRGPSTLSDSLRLVTEGTRLAVSGKSGMWWRVAVPGSGQTGWVAGWVVSEQLIAAPPSASASRAMAWVAEDTINVRQGPSTDDERIATAVQGTPLQILSEEGGWLQVQFENGTRGWVAPQLVRRSDGAAGRGSGDGDSLVQTALGYLGVPYRRGGTSRSGVDCSGLVYAVCRQHGISLPRSSHAMWGRGEAVSRQDLRPGDLVFFKNTYRSGISHVGIYIGNNQFVHAVKHGTPVQVTSLSSGYYTAHWAGAYRVTN